MSDRICEELSDPESGGVNGVSLSGAARSSPVMLVHIGFPKAASTWLQKHVFKSQRLGFVAPWQDCNSTRSTTLITDFVNPKEFDPVSVRANYEGQLRLAIARDMVPVLSNEEVCGSIQKCIYNAPASVRRIAATFPEARVLIVIREQAALLMSCYRQVVKNGSTLTMGEFLGLQTNRKGFRPVPQNFLAFDGLIQLCIDVLGRDRVHVVPFEELKEKHERIVGDVLEFCELRRTAIPDSSQDQVNVGLKGVSLAAQRVLNHFAKPTPHGTNLPWQVVYKMSKELGRLSPRSINRRYERGWKEAVDEHLGDSLRQSNAVTAELIGCDLGRLGYKL